MSINLTERHSLEGVWALHLDNGQTISGCIGTLLFEPADTLKLNLILERSTLPAFFTDAFFKRHEVDVNISRVTGKTNSGRCFLFDVFQSGSHYGVEILNFNLIANMASIALKAHQTIDDDYVAKDVSTEFEEHYSEAEVRYSKLFDWLTFHFPDNEIREKYITCEKCGDRKLGNDYFEFSSFPLDDELDITFNIFYDNIKIHFAGNETREVNASVSIKSKNKQSMSFFVNKIWQLRNILSVLIGNKVDASSLYLKRYITEQHDSEFEHHNILFVQPKLLDECSDNLFDPPAVFKTGDELRIILQNSYAIYKEYPDLFIDLSAIQMTMYLEDRLVSLVKIIDSAYEVLVINKNLNSSEKDDLKSRLEKSLSTQCYTDEEIQLIVRNSCDDSLYMKVFGVVKNTIDLFNIAHPTNYEKLIRKVTNFRHKSSHGQIRAQFKKVGLTFEEMQDAVKLLKCSVYALLLRKMGIADASIPYILKISILGGYKFK